MKIGILTFHRACNYGAVLQAYALQKVIGNLGADCEIIDYRNEVIEQSNHIFFLMSEVIRPRHIVAALLNAPLRLYRRIAYHRFTKKYLKLSKPVYPDDKNKNDGQFDLFITGSDQVWNDKLTGFDRMYFLEGIENGDKKYSYAASFGFSRIPQHLEQDYKALLSSFHQISVREESGRQMVRDLLKTEVSVHVDPTFLIDRASWEKLYKPVKNKGGYLLVYSINRNQYLIDFAKQLSRQKGMPILYILLDITNAKHNRGMKFAVSPDPQRFISLIKDADTVITNSFHGTVFSVIFEKPFYVEVDYGDKYNHRIKSLLDNLNLDSRIINGADIAEDEKAVDWEKTYALLEKYRGTSMEYLKNMISRQEKELRMIS